MYIPHSPSSLSSHTDEVVLGPADREGKGGSLEDTDTGTGGGCRWGRDTDTRGISTISIFDRIMGAEEAWRSSRTLRYRSAKCWKAANRRGPTRHSHLHT
jgi:hypothetical protein